MKIKFEVSLTLLALAGLIEASPLKNPRSNADPVVDLGYAKYEGTGLGTGVNQFLGIRYAAPPLNDLRFRAPQDPAQQDGLQEAKQVRTVLTLR